MGRHVERGGARPARLGLGVHGAREDDRRDRGALRSCRRERLQEIADSLSRIEAADVEPIRRAEARPDRRDFVRGGGAKPARNRARDHRDLPRRRGEVGRDVAAARFAQGDHDGRRARGTAHRLAIESAVEEGGTRPRHEIGMTPGNEIVERKDRGEGKPLRDAVVPRGMEEIGRRIERA
jgi:hypothetical protein